MKKRFSIKIAGLLLAAAIMFACGSTPTAEAQQTKQAATGDSKDKASSSLKISTSGMKFTPETLNAKVGDTITFVIGTAHLATRVDEAAWNANKAASNGGFNFKSGTYTYVVQPSDVGTIYYVCPPHVSFGMKGKIIVTNK